MTEIGRVRTVWGDRVTIMPGPPGACFGCLNRACRARRDLITAENRARLPLSPGQVVETEFPRRFALAQGILVFLPPMAAFAAVWAVTGRFFPELPEPPRAFCGVIALVAVSALICLLRRFFPSSALPRVKRILSGPGSPDGIRPPPSPGEP
jgi:positive regulator of sigma E activity